MGKWLSVSLEKSRIFKHKHVSNISTERKKTPQLKCYNNDLCDLWFGGHRHSIFFFVLRHDSHSVSFWRGKRLKKLVKDCMAISTFQEMSSVPGYSGNGKV